MKRCAEPNAVPRLLVLALEFHLTPHRFGYLTDPSQPLPPAFGAWLSEACAALAPRNLEATSAALGVTPCTLRRTFLFFLRQTLLVSQADHYRILGLSRGSDADAIKQRHVLLMQLFHPDRSDDEDPGLSKLAARINTAYRTLRDSEARARYDAQLPPSRLAVARDAVGFQIRRPASPRVLIGRPASLARGRRQRALAFTLWAAGATAAGGLVFALFMQPDDPVLTMRPECAQLGAPRPAYLQGSNENAVAEDRASAAAATGAQRDVVAGGGVSPRSHNTPVAAPPQAQRRPATPAALPSAPRPPCPDGTAVIRGDTAHQARSRTRPVPGSLYEAPFPRR